MAYLIGTAGHVDHGKTTLLAALTGIDTDRLPEEKARGMTIDIGFAHIDLDGVGRVSIVDVPGHERFIKNMLAGAWGVDAAMLCVAADEGVMPQTREHFEILRLLEARTMVVALTKCDLADDETHQLAEMDVRDLLNGSPYAGAPIVRVSAVKRQGLDELKQALAAAIGSLGERHLDEENWFLPIDRVFSVVGHGTIVTGTLARGRVRAGSEGELMPGGERLRVRSVQTHGEAAEYAEVGQRTALNITGVKREELHRGQAVAAPGAMVETKCVNVRLAAVAELKHGSRVRVHLGAGEFIGKLFLFDRAPGYGQIVFEQPVACTAGQRMVLRRYSPPDLLAGADVVTPNATRRRKNDRGVAELLASAASGGALDERILSEVAKAPLGVETSVISEALGQPLQALGDAFERLKSGGRALSFAGIWMTPEGYRDLAEKVRGAVGALHEQQPQASAVAKSGALAESGIGWAGKAFDRLLAQMAEDGLIALHGANVRHPEYEISVSKKQRALLDRMVDAMREGGAVAPDAATLASEVGAPPQAVEEMWRLGIETGRIVRVEEGLYYAKETLEELMGTVRTLGPRFTIAQFRDATGSSRKYALPILLHFDSMRLTRRVGDERIILD
ncbi:MAG: selenocysteine-specific translation elongation factor [Armatimonadetes bacterium]|nr:selenocysteine-specific translation elongation factor [Armatimonadota bacterium]